MPKRCLKIEDYTVCWICALSIELAAAVEMLDEEFQSLPSIQNDNNIYTLGRIGQHNVAIACLPAGQMGITSAVSVASQMKSRFTSMKFGLMVGIGGGVPSKESDIRFGDVVISQPHMQHGGVVQYDSGKTGVGGYLMRTGSLNSPPTSLLTALAKLRSDYERGKLNLTKHLSSLAYLPEFAHQGTDFDVLYSASYSHISEQACDECSEEEVVVRVLRKSTDPALHFGLIASGNQVMKDSVTRDRLSKELGGILCFEMEAAGLMNDFPCLIIRGICDYADSHKNNRWQPYAAATAAACAKELLHVIPPAEILPVSKKDGTVGEASTWMSQVPKYLGGLALNLAVIGLGVIFSNTGQGGNQDEIQVIESNEPYEGEGDCKSSVTALNGYFLTRGLSNSCTRYISALENKSQPLGL